MGDVDPTPDPGKSSTESGEDLAENVDEKSREDAGQQGPTERPVGTSTARDYTGVDPQEPITGGPTAPSGDQGG
ncbi:hypothetical protein BH23ACT7_BH23ACT7_27830 [soil metagenome]